MRTNLRKFEQKASFDAVKYADALKTIADKAGISPAESAPAIDKLVKKAGQK